MATLFDKIGGKPAVDAAVDIFYDKIMADSALIPFFAGTDMVKQRKKQKAFLTYAFGGVDHYNGEGLRKAHAQAVSQGLNDAHFDAVGAHLQKTLEELSVPAELVQEVMTLVASTRNDVLGR